MAWSSRVRAIRVNTHTAVGGLAIDLLEDWFGFGHLHAWRRPDGTGFTAMALDF